MPFSTAFRGVLINSIIFTISPFLKGQCHEIFCFWFIHESVSLQPQSRFTHKTSGFKTSGFKTFGFKMSETSGLQNVRFTKRQGFKTSGCKKTSIYILYLWLVEIRRFCWSHVCRQSDGCVLFSILEGFLRHISPE